MMAELGSLDFVFFSLSPPPVPSRASLIQSVNPGTGTSDSVVSPAKASTTKAVSSKAEDDPVAMDVADGTEDDNPDSKAGGGEPERKKRRLE